MMLKYQPIFRICVQLVALLQNPLVDGEGCLVDGLVGGLALADFGHLLSTAQGSLLVE